MQDHNGPATCNEDANPLVPCPQPVIMQMIREGSAGTTVTENNQVVPGVGLVEALRAGSRVNGLTGAADGWTGGTEKGPGSAPWGSEGEVGRYYRAARVYNSGKVDESGDLGVGVGTRCYSSDVANRLRGWSGAEDGCDADGMGKGVRLGGGKGARGGLMGVAFGGGEGGAVEP